jgi:hypothetical protein
VRHDDWTVQVPGTLPPQAVTLEQEPPVPPLEDPLLEAPTPPLVEPALVEPAPPMSPLEELPSVLDGLFERKLHAPEITTDAVATDAVAITRAADWTFIERLFSTGTSLQLPCARIRLLLGCAPTEGQPESQTPALRSGLPRPNPSKQTKRPGNSRAFPLNYKTV